MKKQKSRKPGVRYSAALAQKICDRLAAGEPLVSICRRRGMPSRRTIARWRLDVPGFGEDFDFAREEGCELIAVEALRIADTPQVGDKLKIVGDRTEITRGDLLGHRKLQVDSRLRLLARWDPKHYGNKVSVDATHGVTDPVKDLLLQLRKGTPES